MSGIFSSTLSLLPGKGDYMWVTPYALHFGWMHHKQPFYDLADHIWDQLTIQNLSQQPAEQVAEQVVAE